MGPHEADCPDRIMRLLSPVEQIPNPSYTAAWRQRVADNKQKRRATKQMAARLKPGVVIRLEHEATFGTSGVTAIEFKLHTFRKRTPIFEAVSHPGFLCRLHQRTLGTATIVLPSPFEKPAADSAAPPPPERASRSTCCCERRRGRERRYRPPGRPAAKGGSRRPLR